MSIPAGSQCSCNTSWLPSTLVGTVRHCAGFWDYQQEGKSHTALPTGPAQSLPWEQAGIKPQPGTLSLSSVNEVR